MVETRRILVIGIPGAGKSTLARQLSARTGLPLVHLDQLYWQPGWAPSPQIAFQASVTEALEGSRWIIDGTYVSSLDQRVAAADLIVWLDIPRPVSLWRILARVVASWGRVRPDMAEGCPERLDWEFLGYVWAFPSAQTPKIRAVLQRLDAWPRTVVLRGDADRAAFLARWPVA